MDQKIHFSESFLIGQIGPIPKYKTSVADLHIASVWRFLEWEVFVKMLERNFNPRFMLLSALTDTFILVESRLLYCLVEVFVSVSRLPHGMLIS